MSKTDSKDIDYSGVLVKAEIEDLLAKSIEDTHSLVITPYPDEIDSDSIDLKLGSYFFVPRSHRSPCFIPGITNPQYLYHEQYIPFGSYLVLPAHHTVLGSTLEYIKLPSNVSGEILNKSSWARTFITVETAPWIHPLYRGCLTLEIANVSNTPVILYPGVKIAQLVLLKTSSDTTAYEEDKIEGIYIGPVRPEPSKLTNPERTLASLGVKPEDVFYPADEHLSNKSYREHVTKRLKKWKAPERDESQEGV